MGDPQSGSLGLSVVANPSPCCQPNTFVLPGVEPAKDTPEFGFFQPRLPVAPGELPALGLGGGVRYPCQFELGSGSAECTVNHMGLSLPLFIFPLLRSPGDERPLLLFPQGIHNVEGIAVDWMGNNLYWTDDGPKKTISVARLEKAAQTRKTLIEGKMTHPRAIVVDPLNGCGCLGRQGWLPGEHGCSCPQQGPAELAVGSPAPHSGRCI